MLDGLIQSLEAAIKTNLWLGPLAALLGGLLTAANPCVLASVPLMIGYAAGQDCRGPLRSFLLALVFVFGLTITFGVLFLAAWAAGSVLKAGWWQYVAAGVCLIMGLHLLGVLKFNIPAPAGFQPARRGFIGALLLGMLFGLISLPCAGPILTALLSVVPLRGAGFGLLLLAAYTVGHCALVLAGAASVGLVQRLVVSKGFQSMNLWSKRFAGALIAAVGVLLLVMR